MATTTLEKLIKFRHRLRSAGIDNVPFPFSIPENELKAIAKEYGLPSEFVPGLRHRFMGFDVVAGD